MEGLYKGFKKVAEDNSRALLKHDNGHELHIAKSGLSNKHLKALEKLPLYQAEGTKDASTMADQAIPMWDANATDISTGLPVQKEVGAMPIEPTEIAAQGGSRKITPSTEVAPIDVLMQGFKPGQGGMTYEQLKTAAQQKMDAEAKQKAEADKEKEDLTGTIEAPKKGLVPEKTLASTEEPKAQFIPTSGVKPPVAAEGIQNIQEKEQQALHQLRQQKQQGLSNDEAILLDPNASLSDRAQAAQNLALMKQAKRRADDEEFYREQMKPENEIKAPEYFHDQNIFQRILGGIALIAGGVGGALTHQENPAMKMIENSINREIEAQKMSRDRKLNLYKIHREAEGDDLSATIQTANNLKQIALMKMDEAEGMYGNNPMAKLRIQGARTKLLADIAENQMRLSQIDVQKLQAKNLAQRMQQKGTLEGAGTVESPEETAIAIKALKDTKRISEEEHNAAFKELQFKGGNIRAHKAADEVMNELFQLQTAKGVLTSPIQTRARVNAAISRLTPLVQEQDPSKRLNDVTFRKEIEPFIPKVTANKETQQKLLQDIHGLIDQHGIQETPTLDSLSIYGITKPQYAPPPVERRTSDGRTALFNPLTKQFIRYK